MGFLDRYREKKPPTPDRRPLSAPGRAHTEGFIAVEEKNPDLLGQPGFDLYDKMYRTDGDVRQVVQMVVNPISAGVWEVVPYGGQDADEKAQKVADVTKWALWDAMCPNLPNHLQEMLPVLIRSGFAPYEKTWTTAEYDGKTYLVPRKLDLRLPKTIWRWFQDAFGDLVSIVQNLPVPLDDLIARGYPPNIRTQRKAVNGETLMPGEVELRAENILYYRLGAEGDNWEGVSMLRPAYKHWLMKDAIERIDAIAQEREAMGIPICYPPMSASPSQLDDIEDVLRSMRTNDQGYIVAPGPKAGTGAPEGQGWLFEILGYDRSGSGRDPQPSLQYHTHKIAAAFISEFMRLGHGASGGSSGSRATAQSQIDPFLMSIESMVGLLERKLNDDLVKPFVAYNFPDVDQPPKLQMSLVDGTSLTQLADFVMKLTQVGAMLPDADLEEFLRDRADLPPMAPASVKDRGKKDDDVRREVVNGPPGMGGPGDAPGGANANMKPKQKGKTNAPRKPAETKTAKQHSAASADEDLRRPRYRALRPEEEVVNLDDIEDFLLDVPTMFALASQEHIVTRARGENAPLKKSLQESLEACYSYGYQTVMSELDAMGKTTLARNYLTIGMKDRAEHATNHIESGMALAAASSRLNNGEDDEASSLAAAEMEGFRKLRRLAMDQGTAAFMQGRHDGIQLAAAEFEVGVTYSALLDNNTCVECAHADDGVVRSLDDPVRLDRQPPNRHCASTHSGFNHCRCIEIPVLGNS